VREGVLGCKRLSACVCSGVSERWKDVHHIGKAARREIEEPNAAFERTRRAAPECGDRRLERSLAEIGFPSTPES
jgi:hypothetical protein